MLEGESDEVKMAVKNYRLHGEIEEPNEETKIKERKRSVISRPVSI